MLYLHQLQTWTFSMRKKIKHKFFSLIEIFSAISLMIIVSSVLISNFRESLNKGKAFKSKEGARQIYNALSLYYAESGQPLNEIVDEWENIVADSAITPRKTSSNDPTKDGWGGKYKVIYSNDDIEVHSENLESFYKSKNKNEDNYWL